MVRRPIKFKLDAYRMYVGGNHPQQCFEQASKMNNDVALSGCMTNRQYASSYMSDDIKGWIRRQLAVDNQLVHEYFDWWKLRKDF